MADYVAADSLLRLTGPDDGVLEIALDRLQVRNALSTPMLRSLVAFLNTAANDEAVRCVILTGSEEVFAAGSDLAEMAGKDMQGVLNDERPHLFADIARFPKPIVGAVCGYALGGGCELAMHADVLIAGESAQFGQPEINLGIMPGAGGTQRLTRAVGKSLAMKLMLSGEFMTAREALSSGLVAEVTADANCLPRARELARKIAGKAPVAIRLIKEAVLQSFEMPLSVGLVAERRNFVILAGTDDRQEGIAAFLEKRKAVWRGH